MLRCKTFKELRPVFPHRHCRPKFTGVDLATFMDVLQHQLCPDTLR
jgi:hypothetical protein